jgi:hypothetical protein
MQVDTKYVKNERLTPLQVGLIYDTTSTYVDQTKEEQINTHEDVTTLDDLYSVTAASDDGDGNDDDNDNDVDCGVHGRCC